MIGCLRTRVRNQPIIALYFESENVLKLYNLEASTKTSMNLLIHIPLFICYIILFSHIGILFSNTKYMYVGPCVSMLYNMSYLFATNNLFSTYGLCVICFNICFPILLYMYDHHGSKCFVSSNKFLLSQHPSSGHFRPAS